MSGIGFDTERDGLIVNVVKCRPPKNRAPLPAEAAACSGFLKKQMELVKPRFILLLGATALKHIVPEKKKLAMKDVVGKLFEDVRYPGARLMVLFHPAYVLRDPRKKPDFERHLEVFREQWRPGR